MKSIVQFTEPGNAEVNTAECDIVIKNNDLFHKSLLTKRKTKR